MQQGIQEKIRDKMYQFFKESYFQESNVKHVTDLTRKVLTDGYLDFEDRFSKVIKEKESVYKSQRIVEEACKGKIDIIQAFKERLSAIKRELNSVDLSE